MHYMCPHVHSSAAAAKMASSSSSCSDGNSVEPERSVSQSVNPAAPLPKRARRMSHFDPSWISEFPGIGRSSKGL